MKLLKHYILFLTFLLTSVMSKADVGTIETKSTDTDGGITYYTYTRTGVSANTWESFCLPMDIDINSLQTYFDYIYLAYDDEELDFYNDFDEASSAVKRRKTTSNASGITAIAEAYSEESGYWTDAEEAAAATTRYCFAYSAEESSYYHYYIADFSSESSVIIPQGMPFFAHVKSNADLTNGLVLTGHLNTTDTPQTGLVDKEFKVYKDLNLTTLDTDKGFHVIGSLSATDTYSGTLYTISGTGTTTTASSLQQYRAYLTGTDATAILIYPKTLTELENIETPIEAADPELRLDLTDSEPTLVAGTYKAGNVTYTRTVNNYYAGFYVPFDVDLSTMTDNFKAVYIPAGFAIYNPTTDIITMFLEDYDMATTLPAYTPFLAVMTTDDSGTKMSQDVCLTASTVTTIDKFENQPLTPIEVFDYGTNGGLSTTSKHFTMSYGGTLVATTYERTDGYMAFNGLDGSFGTATATKAFRAIVHKQQISTSTSSSAKLICAFVDFDATGINEIKTQIKSDDYIYSIDGRKVGHIESLSSLPKGIYVVNGKKIIK